jgi:hypothetical protein
MVFARALAVLDDASGNRAAGLRAFETILILTIAGEYWLRAVVRFGETSTGYRAQMAIASLCCILAIHVPWRRVAFGLLAASLTVLAWESFPATGNHVYLEVVLCMLASTLRVDDAREQATYQSAVRWLVIVVLFWSGLQKLAHGYWVHGEYVVFSLSRPTFEPVLALLANPDELTRIATLRGEVGDGPYLASSWPLLAASNLVWTTELLLGPLLLWPRTRYYAAIAALALIALVEIGAREAIFGLVFANATLLYLSATLHRSAIVVAGVAMAAMLLSRSGFLPHVTFY